MTKWSKTPPTEPGWYVWTFADDLERLDVAKIGENGYEEGTESWAAPVREWGAIWYSDRIQEPEDD